MPRFTFRFGALKKQGTDSQPEIDLDQIQQKLEEEGIVGEQGNRRWGRKPIKGSDSVYFEFIKELPEKYNTLSDDHRIVSEEISRVKTMHFIIFENGIYGFESRTKVQDIDALEYLFDNFEEDLEADRFDSLDIDTMRDFYKESFEVRKFKAENIGQRKPNPRITDEELKKLTEDTGLRTKSITASVGRAKKNLQDVSLFDDGIVKYSDLPMIRSRDSEGNIRKLRNSGRFDFGTSAGDEEEEEQASEIRSTVRTVMRNLFNVSIRDDSNDEQ